MHSLASPALRVLGKWTSLTAALFLATLALFCAPHAAAQDNAINGQLLDVVGKPWAGIVIKSVSDQGVKQEVKSDKDGNFAFRNLKAGLYNLFIQLPAPNQPYEYDVQLQGGVEAPKLIINFKDIVAKQGAEYSSAQKKQKEDQDKFESMKKHFEAGNGLLTQTVDLKAQLAKAAPAQRDPIKQQVVDLSTKAATELEAAKADANEKDPNNLALILARLGDAYDGAGRTDDAINAYKQAVALKPAATTYNNFGSILGRAGKVDEAIAAYQKSAELDPPNAAQAWRNLGITFYNANRLGDAVEPFQKSVALDPKSAQTWYLLGASLVYKMTTKKVGDKDEVQFAPGTIEAYQKAIELDPNGPWGQEAKTGLEQLQQIAPGIDTHLKRKAK